MTPEEQRALLLECDAQEYKVASGNDSARINHIFEVTVQELAAYTAAVEVRLLEEIANLAYTWPDDQCAELKIRDLIEERKIK